MGKKLGASAHAALVTRGFAEMMRFGESARRTPRDHDRAVRPGRSGAHLRQPAIAQHVARHALGEGLSLDEVLKSRHSVTEGIYTASAVVEMAAARGIDMPIAQAVHAVVSGLATVDEAIEALLARSGLKGEPGPHGSRHAPCALLTMRRQSSP